MLTWHGRRRGGGGPVRLSGGAGVVAVVVLVVAVRLAGRQRHGVHLQLRDLAQHAAGALGGALALEEAAAELALLLARDGHAAALDDVVHQLEGGGGCALALDRRFLGCTPPGLGRDSPGCGSPCRRAPR